MQPAVGGYVLAGGESSRMGQSKALLMLDGRPLVAHAVSKLAGLCRTVHVLSADPALAEFAPLVPDLHPRCGPIGGIEAGLTHSPFDFSLFLPVDLPFLPAEMLAEWLARCLEKPRLRVALFSVDGIPQPTLALAHRDVLTSIERAVAEGHYRLYPELEAACSVLAAANGWPAEEVLDVTSISSAGEGKRGLWFANLNTPEEFSEAALRFAAGRATVS